MTSLAKALGPLDGQGNLPLYQELQRVLRRAIDSRVLGPDDALPSERDLAADFAVPPAPTFALSASQGTVELGGIAFTSLQNTTSITAGTYTFH